MIIGYSILAIISMFKASLMSKRNWTGSSIAVICGLFVSAYLICAFIYGNIVVWVNIDINYIDPALYGISLYFVIYGYFEMIFFLIVLMILVTSLCV